MGDPKIVKLEGLGVGEATPEMVCRLVARIHQLEDEVAELKRQAKVTVKILACPPQASDAARDDPMNSDEGSGSKAEPAGAPGVSNRLNTQSSTSGLTRSTGATISGSATCKKENSSIERSEPAAPKTSNTTDEPAVRRADDPPPPLLPDTLARNIPAPAPPQEISPSITSSTAFLPIKTRLDLATLKRKMPAHPLTSAPLKLVAPKPIRQNKPPDKTKFLPIKAWYLGHKYFDEAYHPVWANEEVDVGMFVKTIWYVEPNEAYRDKVFFLETFELLKNKTKSAGTIKPIGTQFSQYFKHGASRGMGEIIIKFDSRSSAWMDTTYTAFVDWVKPKVQERETLRGKPETQNGTWPIDLFNSLTLVHSFDNEALGSSGDPAPQGLVPTSPTVVGSQTNFNGASNPYAGRIKDTLPNNSRGGDPVAQRNLVSFAGGNERHGEPPTKKVKHDDSPGYLPPRSRKKVSRPQSSNEVPQRKPMVN
ncbi:hypothetical protein B0H17DRAFT_1207015 [Mycena rosella]|uniref:Uncharacterized protein n=1 Tax=Mycena rosella TaxID=1033263 RepID=A0AAD7GCU3_MYCRO|nr:hypothetical protein B0H17DRAFT_1207015 [Mycena rosella]